MVNDSSFLLSHKQKGVVDSMIFSSYLLLIYQNSSRQIDRNAILPEEKTLMRYTVSFLPNNDSGGSNGSAGSFGSFGNYDTVN